MEKNPCEALLPRWAGRFVGDTCPAEPRHPWTKLSEATAQTGTRGRTDDGPLLPPGPPPRRSRRRRRDPRLSPGEEPPAAGSHSGVARREGPCGFRGEDEKGVTF